MHGELGGTARDPLPERFHQHVAGGGVGLEHGVQGHEERQADGAASHQADERMGRGRGAVVAARQAARVSGLADGEHPHADGGVEEESEEGQEGNEIDELEHVSGVRKRREAPRSRAIL